jgi:hypothetical protein
MLDNIVVMGDVVRVSGSQEPLELQGAWNRGVARSRGSSDAFSGRGPQRAAASLQARGPGPRTPSQPLYSSRKV